MKQYEPIPIKPMRLRGVFGIAWNLYKRGFFGMFCYSLIFMGGFLLVSSLLNSASMKSLMDFGEGLDLGGNVYYRSFDGLAGKIGISFLSFLLSIANMLLLQPIFQGGIYTEVSCHLCGSASGFGGMMRRTGYSLRRFFSTQMTQWLMSIAFGVAFFILYFIVIMIAFFSLIPSLLFSNAEPGIGMIIALVVVMLLLVLIFFAAVLFLSFLYPVAANEGVYHFKALGRSFKLVAKRFWRVFGTNLIPMLLLMLVVVGLIFGYGALVESGMEFKLAFLIFTLAVAVVGAVYFPYQASLNTTLYFDARSRFPEKTAQESRPAAGNAEDFRPSYEEQPRTEPFVGKEYKEEQP